jgi:hypothetical protein
MSGPEAGYVQKMPLESGELARQIWVGDLVVEELVDRTCLVEGLDISGKTLWNPTKGSDKSWDLEILWGPDISSQRAGHVRQKPLEFSQLGWTSPEKIGKLVWIGFYNFALHQLTQWVPLDSTELLGLK